MKCIVICVAAFLCSVDGHPAAQFSDPVSVGNLTDEERSRLIYPGTRWCGPGNIAAGGSDFGQNVETDKCCHQHDNCPDYISGWSSSHGLWNEAPYTRLHCDCDQVFYRCLQTADMITKENTLVGHLYFTVLFTRCYREDYPIVRCRRVFMARCLEYEFDESGAKIWQWFDEPFYKAGFAHTGEMIGQMIGETLDNHLSS